MVLKVIAGDRENLDADDAARDRACAQLRQQASHRVDWYGEADAEVAGSVADNRRIDSDDVTAQIEQRTT